MYESFQSEAAHEEPDLRYNSKPGFCRILNFAYPWLHLRKSIKGDISLQDFPLPQSSENCERRAHRILGKIRTKGPSIRRLLVQEFKWELFVCCLLAVMDFMARLANSLLMGHVIRMLTTPTQEIKAQAATAHSSPQISDNALVGVFFGLLFIGIYLKLWVYHYCM